MHFFRTCHLDTFLGQMGDRQGFYRLLPLMHEKSFNNCDIIASQGQPTKYFYIVKTGQIQVHTEILYHVFNIQAIGPSQWNVTRTTRTIQVADKKMITKRGEVFGYIDTDFNDKETQQCFFTAASNFCEIYRVKMRDLIDLASD